MASGVQRGRCNGPIQPLKGVALGGFMGTGKSTVGRLLAQSLGLPFVDMDSHLERLFGPIPEQFRENGEAAFRQRERTLIHELVRMEPAVIATGGGAWVDPEIRVSLGKACFCVVLHASWDTIEGRLKATGSRPLWNEEARALFESRQTAYQWGDFHVETDKLSPERVTEEITKWLTTFA